MVPLGADLDAMESVAGHNYYCCTVLSDDQCCIGQTVHESTVNSTLCGILYVTMDSNRVLTQIGSNPIQNL